MKIGFIGTGLMGQAMALKLLKSGFPVTAYNRTRSKLAPLAIAGATLAESAEGAIEATDCTFLMLTDTSAIRSLILTESAKLKLQGKTLIQMGTISPSESIALKDEIEGVGGTYLEAPVLGSIPEVKAGTLLVMVGATPAQFEQWLGLLKHFSPKPVLIGEVGKAAALKLALNQLIASLTSAFALSLGLVARSGVDIEQFMEILRHSALYAPTFDKKLQRMLDRDFTNPNFPVKHLLKDANLCLEEAQELGLNTSFLAGIIPILSQTTDLGLGDADYSALFAAINPSSDGASTI